MVLERLVLNMNYITNYYKNVCEQLQNKINLLEVSLGNTNYNYNLPKFFKKSSQFDVEGGIGDSFLNLQKSQYFAPPLRPPNTPISPGKRGTVIVSGGTTYKSITSPTIPVRPGKKGTVVATGGSSSESIIDPSIEQRVRLASGEITPGTWIQQRGFDPNEEEKLKILSNYDLLQKVLKRYV